MTVVTYAYRYKRPPKRKKPVALEVPVIMKAADPAKLRKRANTAPTESRSAIVSTGRKRAGDSAAPPANVEHKAARIVTARRPGKRYVDVPELTEEEHRRVGDLADAMMQEFKRKIAEKLR